MFRFILFLLKYFLALVALCVVVGISTYYYFSHDLPSVEDLRNYKPPQVTKVYCSQGELCGEFFQERRTWVNIESLPSHVKNAFLAAEDADFYRHKGLDFLAMVRAVVRTVLPGTRLTGASTISQQACRNLLLTQERTLSRKIREWILTPRMEEALTKDQILALYLNFINFGYGRYGVEEAALFYFGKHAKDLSVGEAAVLAGTVQSPTRGNPVANMVRSKARQKYVLTQMFEHQFLEETVAKKEMEKPIVLGPRLAPTVGSYYLEEIRKMLVARYGDKKVLTGGLRVDIAMDVRLQQWAEKAVREGLESIDRRLGYRGALGTLDKGRFLALRPFIAHRAQEAGRRKDEALVADFSNLTQQSLPPAPTALSEEDELATISADEKLAEQVALIPLKEGARLVGYVSAVDDARKTATVDLVTRTATLPFSTATWARPRKNGRVGIAPTKMSEIMTEGQWVGVKITQVTLGSKPLEATLDQIPEVQGALTVISPDNRHVVALVGGYDFERSAFNRAIQAKRQPGSSFKPFVYGAAMGSGKFTPLSIVNDAPEAIRDAWTGKTWKPQNFEKGGFEGPMTIRAALTKSKNTVSVRLVEALTPQTVIDFAQKAGIASELPNNLTLALGTGEVSQLEMANAYATLQSLGRYAPPLLLLKVTDAQGVVLEEYAPAFEELLPPAVAYLTTSLMHSVVEDGTAMAVKELNRPAAGKTGTAQEFRDAWFSGYTVDYVASSWVGFDNHDPIGPSETGGKAALPIWLDFMRQAQEGLPVRDFEVPEGITEVRVDPSTGLLAGNAVPGRLEPFLTGTEPTHETTAPGQVSPTDYFLQEQEKRGGL